LFTHTPKKVSSKAFMKNEGSSDTFARSLTKNIKQDKKILYLATFAF
jgi:hypothetical protein